MIDVIAVALLAVVATALAIWWWWGPSLFLPGLARRMVARWVAAGWPEDESDFVSVSGLTDEQGRWLEVRLAQLARQVNPAARIIRRVTEPE